MENVTSLNLHQEVMDADAMTNKLLTLVFNETLAVTSISDASVPMASTAVTQDDDTIRLARQLDATRFVVQRVLVPLVVACGVTGNLLTMAVMTRQHMRSSTNNYLTALALFDSLYLLAAAAMSLHHYPSVRDQDSYVRYAYPWGKPLTDTFSNTTVWLTVTFTAERLVAVSCPLRAQVWCTQERSKHVIAVVCLSSFFVTLPSFFEFTTVEQTLLVGGRNVTKPVVQMTSVGTSDVFRLGYPYTMQALFAFGPFILLTVFNTLLMQAVVRAATQRNAMSGATLSSAKGIAQAERHRREQHLITVMLIVVVGVFLVCMLPQAVQNLLVAYLTASGGLTRAASDRLRISGNVFNLLVMLNSAVNFILYSYLSVKFRRTFRLMFCRCLWADSAMRQAGAVSKDGVTTAVTIHGYNALGDRKISSHSLLAVGCANGKPSIKGSIGALGGGASNGGYVRVRSSSSFINDGGDKQLEMSRRRNYFPMQNFAHQVDDTEMSAAVV